MKQGMTKNSAGIGGKIESLPCLGAFVTMTGGSAGQRRIDRDYRKGAHREHDKALAAKLKSDGDGDEVSPSTSTF